MLLQQWYLPLLDFLNECNNTSLPRKILDCGAGGSTPPLAIFYKENYETYGIDISENQINKANDFAQKNGMKFNIIKGDIRNLPYEDQSFSFVFSHHTIFHMSKDDIRKTLQEMERVLVPEGLLFVNVRSVDSRDCGGGKEIAPGEFLRKNGSREAVYSFHKDNELDSLLDNFDIIFKRKWTILIAENWMDKLSMIEYIARKKG